MEYKWGRSKKLYLSHQQYAEMLQKKGELSTFTPSGEESSQFMAWVMQRYNLEPFCEYQIVVE